VVRACHEDIINKHQRPQPAYKPETSLVAAGAILAQLPVSTEPQEIDEAVRVREARAPDINGGDDTGAGSRGG
jgi:predicted aconitase with swiveling domain